MYTDCGYTSKKIDIPPSNAEIGVIKKCNDNSYTAVSYFEGRVTSSTSTTAQRSAVDNVTSWWARRAPINPTGAQLR